MKSFLQHFIFSSLFISTAIFALGKQYEWDPINGQRCSFLCDIIPPQTDVLKVFGSPSSMRFPYRRLKALAWNLYKGRTEDFQKEFIKLSHGKDLILTSEMSLAPMPRQTYDQLKGFHWAFATQFLMSDGFETGVGIGSKTAPSNMDFSRTEWLEPYVKAPKTIVMATYPLTGTSQELLVLSIHGMNFRGNEGIEKQIKQILPKIKSHDGPVLFAGDFNTKNNRRLETVRSLLKEAGLTRVQWENPNEGKQLDDAFVRGLVIHRALINRETIDLGSDHPALEINFSY